jgi:hypothetical protein
VQAILQARTQKNNIHFTSIMIDQYCAAKIGLPIVTACSSASTSVRRASPAFDMAPAATKIWIAS